ncbi:MAG: hypothetical protein KKA76_05585 [Proteobacteria bacterium]|nr:hypothetical protein [Pseudomonadota bacterium]
MNKIQLTAELLVEIFEQFGGYVALVYTPNRTRQLFDYSLVELQKQITDIIEERNDKKMD